MELNLITSHGKIKLTYQPIQNIFDVMRLNEIPWTSVTCFGRISKLDQELHLVNNITNNLYEFEDKYCELNLFLHRNINPTFFQKLDFDVSDLKGNDFPASYFFYQKITDKEISKPLLKYLTAEDCRNIVATNVHEVLRRYLTKDNNKIVLGVSGGGDSNAMLYAISTFEDFKIEIIPVIVTGLNEWDRGLSRASQLCAKYNLKLNIVTKEECCRILGFKDNNISHLERFEKFFPGDDFEVFSVHMIYKCLEHVAKTTKSNYFAIGANMDDKLSEVMYCVQNGLKFFEMPARKLGDITLLYPLWKCPKITVDGCFPKLALENYEDRYPSYAPGRGLYYWLSYSILSQNPGFASKLLDMASMYSYISSEELSFDESLNMLVSGSIDPDVKNKIIKMMSL